MSRLPACMPGVQGDQEGASDPLDLETQIEMVVSHHVCVLGSKPGSSATAERSPPC